MESREESGRQAAIKRFLGWVNADEEFEHTEEDEEPDDNEHDDHDDPEDEDEDEAASKAAEAPLEDYEGDDEFDYPDEIVVMDDSGVLADLADDEIDYADTAPAYQETVHMTKKQKIRMRRFRAFYLVLSAVVTLNIIGVLLLTVNYLPPFGGVDNPAVNEVYLRYVEQGVEDTGALNLVAAVLYAYRSFDTLGEAFVLFTAAIGVILLLRETKGKESE